MREALGIVLQHNAPESMFDSLQPGVVRAPPEHLKSILPPVARERITKPQCMRKSSKGPFGVRQRRFKMFLLHF